MKRISWGSEVAAIYTKEFRCLLRDQHTVIYSFVIPVFLYPALVWGVIQILTYARAVQDRAVSTVRVEGDGSADQFIEHLKETPKLRLAKGDEIRDGVAPGDSSLYPGGLGSASAMGPDQLAEVARSARSREAIDAWVHLERRAEAGSELHVGMDVLILFNSTLDASVKARERLGEAIKEFRRERLLIAARDLEQDDEFVSPLTVTETNIASREEFSKYMASLILPLLMLIMTALGALYPALDVTVGEKERGCLETTLIAPVGRAAIVIGKYLAVVSFALIAFLMNFTSMVITLFHQGSVLKLQPFALGWSSVAIILTAALLLSAFFSAIMMLIAIQAKTFKEGQSYIMPVYLLAALPILVVARPDVMLDMTLAFVPVLNIALLFRGALQGNLSTEVAAASLCAAVLYAAVVLAFAIRYLQRGDLIAERAGWRLRKSQIATNDQIPNPKSQIPMNDQIPMTKSQ